MVKRIDVGTLIQHQGTISGIEFYQDNHMFTSSVDGTICVWDTRNWECLKTLRGHKGPVNCISIHSSGKMLLSVSKDKTLRTWNLIKGRCAYITNLKAVADRVLWAPNGRDFLVIVESRIDMYNITIGGVVRSLNFGKRINSVVFIKVSEMRGSIFANTSILLNCFLLIFSSFDTLFYSRLTLAKYLLIPTNTQDMLIAVGGEYDSIAFYNLETGEMVFEFKAHENRIKALYSTYGHSEKQDDTGYVFLFSVSSDGLVKLWQVDKVSIVLAREKEMNCSFRPSLTSTRTVTITHFSFLSQVNIEPILLTSVDTTCRPTCMAVFIPQGSNLIQMLTGVQESVDSSVKENRSSKRTKQQNKEGKRAKVASVSPVKEVSTANSGGK